MTPPYSKTILIILALALISAPAPVAAGPREAYRKVHQGMDQYAAADYDAAAESFGKALSVSPHDLRIVYNQACAARARGELDQAVEWFQKAAISDELKLAAACRYNLGVIASDRATEVFGERPEEADKKTRSEGIEHLARAIAHYRGCLSVDPQHTQARHNLEVVRLWLKHMEEVWRLRDRQRRREQTDLLTFLRYIDAQQRTVRSTTRSLARLPDSPKRRQAVRVTATSQKELAEEIEPLKSKIEAEAAKAFQAAAGNASEPVDPQAQQQQQEAVLKPLLDLCDQAGTGMLDAARFLNDQQLPDAGQTQTAIIDQLDELFMGLTDFPQLLERSIEEQQTLVDRVDPVAADPDEAERLDTPDLAWRQRFVEDWSRMLVVKAESELARLPSPDGIHAEWAAGEGAFGESDPTDPDQQKKAADLQQLQQQLESLKESIKKAQELAPRVTELTGGAADHLDAHHPSESLPLQQEALKLLQEIAEPLRKQQQQQDQDQQDQQQDQQQQPDDQQQDKQEEEQKKRDQEQPQGNRQEQQAQRKQLTEKELQALIENVRERKRKRDEQMKKIRAYITRPSGVDKDW